MIVASLVVAAAAVAVPLLIALVRRPQRGVLLLAALVPFDGLLLIVPHEPWMEQWKQALVLAVVAATLVAPAHARGRPGRRPPGWLAPVAALTALGLLSALTVGGAQGVEGFRIGFFYLLTLLALWRCPLDGRERDLLVSVLMVDGVVTAAYGLVQQVVGGAVLNAWGYAYNTAIRGTGGFLRSISTFEQPFPFGLYLMTVLLVGTAVALADPRRRRNRVFLLLSPVLLAGLLASTVRAAMLGVLAGAVFLAVFRHRGLIHLIVPLGLGALFVPGTVYTALLSSDSLDDRTTGWTAMIDVMLRSPFGVGIGSTGSAGEKAAEATGGTAATVFSPQWSVAYQPDDYYVKTMLELGPLGLWLLVLLLCSVFTAACRASRRWSGSDAALAAGFAACLVATGVASLFCTYFEIFPMDVLFWLFVGVLATVPERGPTTAAAAAGGLRPAHDRA